ncbi:MAG: ABC transporter ATP-binding protein [Bacillota bacterium]
MNLLEVADLRVTFTTYKGLVRAVNGVNFNVKEGEIIGLVGESGSGKTVTALSLLRLISEPPGKIEGAIYYRGEDLLKKKMRELNKIRGKDVSMIFQNPGTALNPVFTIGEQITRVISMHRNLTPRQARQEALSILELVGLPHPGRILHTYPHQLSGGMKQRIIIGIALSCQASLLIADEPTTALDVTIQAQILKLLLELRERLKVAIILITHDVGVAAQTCDRMLVMYGGTIVETGPTAAVLSNPRHPYTEGLLGCLPYQVDNVFQLATIPGAVPDMLDLPDGCSFHPRCTYREERCCEMKPSLFNIAEERQSACFMVERGGSDVKHSTIKSS